MRFKSISIRNYRQYRNIDFAFDKGPVNDLHVILASNGVGKTNLLNAINWCLYEEEPHTAGRADFFTTSADRLPLANIDAVNDAIQNGENRCEVKVTIAGTDGDTRYTLERKAHFNARTPLIPLGRSSYEITETLSTGETKFYTGETANEITSILLPKKIREYFFFDGERLLNYFDNSSKNTSHLRDSIYQIAQVNAMSDVESHLDYFITDYNRKINQLSPDIQPLLDAFLKCDDNVKNKEKEIEELDNQIKQAEDAIKDCDKIIEGSKEAVQADDKIQENRKTIALLGTALESARKELRLFAKDYLIRLALYERNCFARDYIDRRQREEELSPVPIDILEKSAADTRCLVCGETLTADKIAEIKKLIEKYKGNAALQKLCDIRNDVVNATELPDFDSLKADCFNNIKTTEKQIDDLEKANASLAQISFTMDGEEGLKKVRKAMENKQDLQDLRERNIEKKGAYKTQLSDLKEAREAAEKAYNRALSSTSECNEYKEKRKLVTSAKALVTEIKNEIVTDVKKSLEKRTMEIFDSLLWKKETYDRVELDDNFAMKLYHKQTGDSCLDSCSAAEKELLALAFTVAVHEVSGYDNVLFIDTPVGRVSDDNRTNFAKVLLDIGQKKQIILAFTPSEYSSEISSVLNDRTASSFSKIATDEHSTRKE